jgi:peroxiredoxin
LPDFVLKDQNNDNVESKKLKGKKLLLSFHPLAWTKICAQQMQSLEASNSEFNGLNTAAYGFSVDSAPSKKAWAKSLGIEKTALLSDFWPHGGFAQQLGLFREKDGFSERANIIVDENQKVIFCKIYEIKQLPEISEIIDFLHKYKGGTMENTKEIHELLAGAMNAEIGARDFYTRAAQKAQSNSARMFFSDLAGFEQKHYEKVRAIIESLKKNDDLGSYEMPVLNRSIKPELDGEVEPNKDEIIEILTLAIKSEQDARNRYLKIARMINNPQGITIFGNLAEDERRHHDLLEAQYYQMSNKGMVIWE